MKICNKCGEEKEEGEFQKERRVCKCCQNKYKKQHYLENNVRCKKKSRQYYIENKEKVLQYRKQYYIEHFNEINLQKKQYELKNKDKTNNKRKQLLDTNINCKLKKILRCRMTRALKGNYKSGSAVRDLGCSIDFLKYHLESLFLPGMSWDNYGRCGWHIDHIKPLDSFDLSDPIQFKKACHYTNLQPLWAHDNIIKSDKILSNS